MARRRRKRNLPPSQRQPRPPVPPSDTGSNHEEPDDSDIDLNAAVIERILRDVLELDFAGHSPSGKTLYKIPPGGIKVPEDKVDELNARYDRVVAEIRKRAC